MPSRLPNLKFLAGRSNLQLATNIAAVLKLKGYSSGISPVKFIDFANGEMKVKLEESMRGEDVFILQTSAAPNPDKWMMELFLMAHTARKASARRITAVIPYIYGCRQDKKSESRTPITIQLIGDLLQASGVKRLLTVSLHNPASTSAFGDIIVDHLSSMSIFYPMLEEMWKEERFMVISPDAGGVPRAKTCANHFGAELGFCYKARPGDNKSKVLAFVGDVENKNIVILDDIVDTGGTHIKCAQAAKDRGAKKVTLVVAHPVLSTHHKTGVPAVEALSSRGFDEIIISDSISHENLPGIFKTVSLGTLLGDTIARINSDESVGEVWENVIR